MLTMENKGQFLEIKEIEKFSNLIYIQVINVDPSKKPEENMKRTEIHSADYT